MLRLALKMLVGDKTKYLSLVVGLSFAVFLITQQGSIFFGLLLRSTGFLQNIGQPDLWVCNPYTKFIGDVRPMTDDKLQRVRSVPGVEWAEPLLSMRARVDLPGGQFKTAQLIGISRSTLAGRPPDMVAGALHDLRSPDAVLVEESSIPKLEGVKIGDTLRLNDQRALVVGICRAKLGFDSNALLYTTFDNAMRFVPMGRERLGFIMVKVKPGADLRQVQAAVNHISDIKAFTRDEIEHVSTMFILKETGIGINFGITVMLGFIVGLIVAATMLYQFTADNIRHFAVLQAMGVTRMTMAGMIVAQSLTVGLVAYGIGTGLAGVASLPGRTPGAELTTYYPWELMFIALAATLVCVSVGGLLSLRRVLTVEVAMVFK